MLCDNGYASLEIVYDARGSEIRNTFLAEDGRPVYIVLYYANGGPRQVYSYYEAGKTVLSSYDEAGNLTSREEFEEVLLPETAAEG